MVCDSTALFRNLPLLLQIKEVRDDVIVVLNMSDEATRLGIELDGGRLAELVGCPVVKLTARKKSSVKSLLSLLDGYVKQKRARCDRVIRYPALVERAAVEVVESFCGAYPHGASPFWVALRLIEGDTELCAEIMSRFDTLVRERVSRALLSAGEHLYNEGLTEADVQDLILRSLMGRAEEICRECVKEQRADSRYGNGRLDRMLTGKYTAYPIMALFVGLCFFITMRLANYPSQWLECLFNYIGSRISLFLTAMNCPSFLMGAICDGMLSTLFTVVAVMLPPMAIFFPLFSLLEEVGYLPRIAYNLDRPFACSGACGKQALTMCMGIGCNAVGVRESRIIDSRRERLLAILTNSFMPCNGRLPILASLGVIVSLLAFGSENGVIVAVFVTFCVLFGVFMTFPVTKLLSLTLLRGERSSFTIELPPYRRPEIIKVVWRSLKGKVVSVLLRAVTVACPMGLLIFLMSYISVSGAPLLFHVAELLGPLGAAIGLDGAILLAFILALPASEIVLPLMVSIYALSGGGADLSLYELLLANGWDAGRAVCTAVFCIFHFPCSTTLITIYKETKSLKYTAVSALMPTLLGALLCAFINLLFKVF